MNSCKFCKKQFQTKQALAGHQTICKLNPGYKETIKKISNSRKKFFNKVERDIICPKCGKHHTEVVTDIQFQKGKFKKYCCSACAHSRKVSQQQKIKTSNSLKALNLAKQYTCVICGSLFTLKDHQSKICCSTKCSQVYRQNLKIYNPQLCQKFSKIAKANHYGGVNKQNYQKFKRGWYKGIYCGSSWQLAFVIYQLDLGLTVKRCQKVFQYEYQGQVLNYYPDFQIDNVIYQVKGYQDQKARLKHKLFPFIEYFDKVKMKPILKYVKEKYGKNFIELFEKHP